MATGTGSTWKALAAELDSDFVDTRIQTHWGVQLIAAAARRFAIPRSDDGHTSMDWLAAESLFAGQPIDRLCDSRVIYNPLLQRIAIRTPGVGDSAARPLPGSDLATLLGALAADLRQLDLGAEADRPESPAPAVLEVPDYDLPDHAVGHGAPFELLTDAKREELCRWYANAARVLQPLREDYPCATPLRCWPHHFDLALRIELDPDERNPERARSIGVGLSPGDPVFEYPYFYVTPWPYPPDHDLPALDGGGRWQTRGWVGAVLLGETLLQHDDPELQERRTREFLRSAVDASAALLGTGSGPIC